MAERFAPGVVIDGRTVYPPGWMWVFALALRGCPWAEEEIARPEFDAVVRQWFRDQAVAELEEQKADLEARLSEVMAQLERLRRGGPCR